MKKGYLILFLFMVNCYCFSFTHTLTPSLPLSLSMKLGFRNHHSQEVLIERRFVLGFYWKENSYKFLSLLDNNITKKPNCCLYVIHKLKSLRLLDFKKVKHKVYQLFRIAILMLYFWLMRTPWVAFEKVTIFLCLISLVL
ncbi:uncharacterized protein LOC114309127 isoform X2 [Camellia sinensis]|uniref:uncharacterized protein LOC114309127 isoform X2 n=1 Tax=Camellia sinensis TaxID=4442 RepID=UPI001035FC9A|nr:uncharacterized protein LOC114309127 isoform X2 [Camellia sinensis]